MSIKVRLLLSYIAMLIVPIILTVLVAMLAGFYYFNDAQKAYDVKFKLYPFSQATDESDKLFSDIKLTSIQNPENFQNEKYLNNLEKKMGALNSGVIVRKNDHIVYSSSSLAEFNTAGYLPKFGVYKRNITVPYSNKKVALILSQQDFYFKDKESGSVFLATNVGPLKKAFSRLHITTSIFIIIILIATNGTLTFIVAKSIIKPLYKLKASANEIKEGNLDFVITTDSRDEIGEVCTAFEEMRALQYTGTQIENEHSQE